MSHIRNNVMLLLKLFIILMVFNTIALLFIGYENGYSIHNYFHYVDPICDIHRSDFQRLNKHEMKQLLSDPFNMFWYTEITKDDICTYSWDAFVYYNCKFHHIAFHNYNEYDKNKTKVNRLLHIDIDRKFIFMDENSYLDSLISSVSDEHIEYNSKRMYPNKHYSLITKMMTSKYEYEIIYDFTHWYQDKFYATGKAYAVKAPIYLRNCLYAYLNYKKPFKIGNCGEFLSEE